MKKKIVQIFKDNVVGLIFGIVFALSIGVIYAATNYLSQDVKYVLPNNAIITSASVKGALDQLFTRISDYELVRYAFGNPTTTSTPFYTSLVAQGHNVFASLYPDGSKAACLVRNGKLGCFKNGTSNWASNKYLVQAFFSDVSCNVFSDGVECISNRFTSVVLSDGSVYCYDYDTYEYCSVSASGAVNCGHI